MKKIKLTKGKYTLVDDRDFEWLNQWKWLCQGTQWGGEYAARRTKNKYILMHRLILGVKEGEYVDHKNGDGLDNRRYNLRNCTNAENGRNRKGLNKNNTSGFRGITRYKRTDKWLVQIMVNRKGISLGHFATKAEANKVAKLARKKYFGEFAGI